MKIILISDTHNYHKDIKWNFDISQANLIIFSGDLSSMGWKHEVDSFFRWFSKLPIQYKIIIAGNHDLCFCPEKMKNQRPEWLTEILDEYLKYENIHFYLENSGCEIEGIKFWGSPISPSFNRTVWGFNKDRGDEIKKVWKQIPTGTKVLITHTPPHLHGDWIPETKEFVGCESLRYYVKKIKPLVHCFGHIHSGYGMSYDDNTTYFNGSLLNNNYELVNKPILFEINNNEVNYIEY